MQSIGYLIKSELEHQERSVSWLAKKIGCSRTVVYRIFEKDSIDTGILLRISIVLKRNFFDEYAGEYVEACNKIVQ